MSALLVESAQAALLLSLWLALPVVATVALVGALVSTLQAAAQVQDPSVTHLPKLLAASAALLLCGGWMARSLTQFATQMFLLAAS